MRICARDLTLLACTLAAFPAQLASQARPASVVPPALAAPIALRLPTMIERTLPNGLKLVIVEQHELPLVDVALVVRSGSESDPADKKGLATLTADLLEEGAGSRDALELADQIGFLAVQLSTSSGFDRSTVSMHFARVVLDSAVALMADIILRPTFAAKEFIRVRNERLIALLQEQDRGPQMADRAFAAIVFGASHPYGSTTGGTREGVERITRDDVQAFWSTRYRPNNSTLVLVGDLSVAEAEAFAAKAFGGWKRADVPRVVAFALPALAERMIYIVDKPKAAQSSFRIGGIGVARNTKDYYPLLVMNTALGGSFTSRLNQNLRETKGYTYGAGSNFSMRRNPGPFTAGAEVVAAKTDSALIEFMNELNAIRLPLPVAELAKTKRYLRLGYAERFESTRDIASQVAGLVPFDLPLSTLGAFDKRVGAVTRADVQRVARRYLDVSKLSIVIAGDRATIEPSLKALKLAPVEIRDAQGRPVVVP